MGSFAHMAAMPDIISAIRVPKQEDARYCEARLRLLVETLPVTIYFNPIGVAIACLALWLGRAELGNLSLLRMAAAVGLQCIAGAGTYVAWRLYRSLSCESVGACAQGTGRAAVGDRARLGRCGLAVMGRR